MMMLIYAFMFFILLEISILSAFTENVQARSRKKLPLYAHLQESHRINRLFRKKKVI